MASEVQVTADIFLNDTPLLDVRAPVEYAHGAFPNATNLPLLDDEERRRVGTQFRLHGQKAAVQLGNKLISGAHKAQRLNHWEKYARVYPGALLYCARGGLRSRIVQQWLKDTGVDIPRVRGGYKKLRRFLFNRLQRPPELLLLGGQTGVGKTELLLSCRHRVDLEGLANHRGSAFGHYPTRQPAQINFENRLAIDLLKVEQTSRLPVLVEDEGRFIGRVNIPPEFLQAMKNAALVVLTAPLEERVQRIYQEYVVERKRLYQTIHPLDGHARFQRVMLDSLGNIHKRLGGDRHRHLHQLMQRAMRHNDAAVHRIWIADLLQWYYDPMYRFQLEKKADRVYFTGDRDEVREYLADYF